MHVRCSYCRARRTLRKPREEYQQLPRCRGCGKRMTQDGKPPPGSKRGARFYARYWLDRYRARAERGPAAKPCIPGRGGCCNYSFPHRRGSGFCIHNHRLTDALLQKREEEGCWA